MRQKNQNGWRRKVVGTSIRMFSPNQATRPFPVANALPSYWRKHAHSIDEYRSTADLPNHCDIVIIGAGYSGASIAHHLIEQNVSCNRQMPAMLILEAREACSGATGRNGTSSISTFLLGRITDGDKAATSSPIRSSGRQTC